MAEPNFEKDLERLEAVVAALEEGGLPLDEALKRFEEGVRLHRRCEKALAEAERKIEMLVQKSGGEFETVPFDESGESAGNGVEPPKKRRTRSKEAPEPVNDGEGGEEEDDDDELLF